MDELATLKNLLEEAGLGMVVVNGGECVGYAVHGRAAEVYYRCTNRHM